MEEKKKGPVDLKFAEDMQVIFANMVRVSHTPAELVLDFAQMLPGQDQMEILSRIIMTPIGAKLFYTAMRENLARYEATFGEIVIPHNSSLANDLFRSVQPPKGPDDKPQDPQE